MHIKIAIHLLLLIATFNAFSGIIHVTVNEQVSAQNALFIVDVNNDGIEDFIFEYEYESISQLWHVSVRSDGAGVPNSTGEVSGNVFFDPNIGPYINILVFNCNDTIQAPQWDVFGTFCSNPAPPIPTHCDITEFILGLRLEINGAYHYGWFKLASTSNPLTATLIEYAWNDEPDEVILACQTTDSIFVSIASADELQSVKVAPNPFESELQINSNMNEPYRVIIYNQLGKVVYLREKSVDQNLKLQIALPSGIYFLHVEGITIRKQVKVVRL